MPYTGPFLKRGNKITHHPEHTRTCLQLCGQAVVNYLGGGHVGCCTQEMLRIICWGLVVVHRRACGGNYGGGAKTKRLFFMSQFLLNIINRRSKFMTTSKLNGQHLE